MFCLDLLMLIGRCVATARSGVACTVVMERNQVIQQSCVISSNLADQ